MNITENLQKIRAGLPEEVSLVAVSKTRTVEEIMEAYRAGQRIFGENKIQEMTEKQQQLPEDIQWHMIGHVQRNKVKYMAGYVSLIHSIDSLALLKEVEKQAAKHRRTISCLLQIRIAAEDTKYGMTVEAARELLHSGELRNMKHVCITGLMGMATFTEDKAQIKKEFLYLKTVYEDLRSLPVPNVRMSVLSTGMSDDYNLALQCGSTMVRIGSRIFGARQYSE